MCLALSVAASAKDVKLTSPGGSLTVTVGVDGGKAWYSVTRGQEAVINRSELGFVLTITTRCACACRRKK